MKKRSLASRLFLTGIALVGSALAPVSVYSGEAAKPRGKTPSSYDFSKDSEEILLAKMIYGEARSCSYDEQLRVGFTAVNRANDNKKRNGTNVKGAILAKYQYSCFNNNDPNRKLLEKELSGDTWNQCLRAAREVLSGDLVNLTEDTHYHTPAVKPKWKNSPNMIPTGRERGHLFYRER